MLVVLAFSYLFLFHHLGSYSLKEPDEGRYAEIPREMVEQGDTCSPISTTSATSKSRPFFTGHRPFPISPWG